MFYAGRACPAWYDEVRKKYRSEMGPWTSSKRDRCLLLLDSLVQKTDMSINLDSV